LSHRQIPETIGDGPSRISVKVTIMFKHLWLDLPTKSATGTKALYNNGMLLPPSFPLLMTTMLLKFAALSGANRTTKWLNQNQVTERRARDNSKSPGADAGHAIGKSGSAQVWSGQGG